MVSFTSLLVAASAIVGAFALPTDVAKRGPSELIKREQGTNGGYFYQFCTPTSL